LSRLSAAHAPNLAHRSAQNKPEKIKQAIEALRAGICPAARSRPHQRWERGPTVCVKEKGEREREKIWVFHSRIDFELNSVVRGRAGADTPMSIQDFDLPMSIQDDERGVCELKSTQVI